MGQLMKFLRERFQMETRRCNYSSEPDDDIDRINNLPEELRVHILSFLRIKEAAQTCVLSKTWKNTWASVPILFFSLREFLLDGPIQNLSGEIIREREHKFEKFVQAVLQNRETSGLSHFALFWVTKDCVSCNSEAFRDCILRALEFKPRFFAVYVCKDKLVSCYKIFTCDSLQEVLLASKGEPNIEIAPNSVDLPFLKRLELAFVTVNDDFLDKLFLGCPIIEELFLGSCILNASRISSGTLKSLAIVRCYFSKSGPELMNSLSKVTRLNLSVRDTEVKGLFEKGVPHWPIFKSLESLKLGGWCLNSDFGLVAFFLRSPNLQRLMLHDYNPRDQVADDKSNWEEPKVADDKFRREWLEKVKIMKQGRSDEWVHQLIKNLHAHVKTIGEIQIV